MGSLVKVAEGAMIQRKPVLMTALVAKLGFVRDVARDITVDEVQRPMSPLLSAV